MSEISADRPVVLIGAGKMGGAMLDGWLHSGHEGCEFVAIDPGLDDDRRKALQAQDVRCMSELAGDLTPSVVIVAVKPQMMEDVLPSLKVLAQEGTVFVSVAAGTPISTFERHLGGDVSVIRTIPNTPSQVGRGITVGYAAQTVSDAQCAMVAQLLTVTGAFDWVDHETLIDAATAVSGSGPAYVFYLVEALAEAAEATGLSPELSLKLARTTVEGAGELLYQSDLDAGTLRQNVTSPGGTTAAALAILMADDGLRPLMERAVLAAKRRAEELAR